MLCGNKVDMREALLKQGQACISRQQGEALARDFGAHFQETSARTGQGMVEAIVELGRWVAWRHICGESAGYLLGICETSAGNIQGSCMESGGHLLGIGSQFRSPNSRRVDLTLGHNLRITNSHQQTIRL